MIKLKIPIKASYLCKVFKLKYSGEDRLILGISSLSGKMKNALCFSNDDAKSKDKIIIQRNKFFDKNFTVILHRNPRLLFCKFLNYFLKNELIEVNFKKNVIDKNIKIPEGSILGDNIKIEKNCIIEPGAKIFSNVIIKKNSIIRSGAIIGAYGFGYQRDKKNKPIEFPQFGSVLINENVHVGNNTCIAISTFDKTIIGKNTKIDNLVHVAHNVVIGSDCVITANCQIAGSVKIGNNVWMSPSCTIKNKILIGNNVFIGIGSVVIFDINKNDKVFGNPAQTIV